MSDPPPAWGPEPRPGLDRDVDVPWTVGTAVWAWILSLASITIVGSVTRDPGVLLPATSVATALAVLAVVGLRHRGSLGLILGRRRPGSRAVLQGVAWGIGAYVVVGVAVSAALTVVIESTGRGVPDVQPTLRALAGDESLAGVFAVSVVVLAPLAEEMLFRGVLYQALRARLGRRVAVGGSAVAFGLVHLSPVVTLAANALVFVVIASLGAILAWSLQRSGTLVVPVTAHAVYNAIGLVLLTAA